MNRNRSTLIALAALLLSCSAPDRYDVLIVNGTVYDGSLRSGWKTNIGITGDRIVSMNVAADAVAETTIDAEGLVVVPGFIDPHTHADDDLFASPGNVNANYLHQGVATVFVGNDGDGLPEREDKITWARENGIGTNMAFFAGHGMIRETVMSLENRAPTDEELDRMRGLVADEMRAGALGLSTGLFYTPDNYADTEEVIELAKVAAGFGGVYDSHMRDESSYNIGLLGSVKEVIRIGEEAAIPVHIAHLKALGRDVWGQSGDIIALVAAARERGVEVTADQYPWRASGTRFSAALIPAWVRADSSEAMFERLANPDLQDRIREEMEANLWRRGGSDSMLVTGDSEWQGMTLTDITIRTGMDPIGAAIEVVRAGNPSIASFNMNADDIEAIAIQPWVMTGSDGSTGHPRKYASYPKAYQDFVADSSLMPIEQFVHRSTGLVADSFRLCDRGYLEEGRIADIVVIDLERFLPVADFADPTALSTGVQHLLVSGVFAIRAGELTGRLPGAVVDRQNLECP